jgi:hypothetical protein
MMAFWEDEDAEWPTVYIRSCRQAVGKDGHPALSAHPDGIAKANRYGPARAWEGIQIVLLKGTRPRRARATIRVALKGYHGKFLSAPRAGELTFSASSCGTRETFELSEGGDNGSFTIRASHGMFVTNEGKDFVFGRGEIGGRLVADRAYAGLCEFWHITSDPHEFTDQGCTARAALEGTLLTLQVLSDGLLGPHLHRATGGVLGSTPTATRDALRRGAAAQFPSKHARQQPGKSHPPSEPHIQAEHLVRLVEMAQRPEVTWPLLLPLLLYQWRFLWVLWAAAAMTQVLHSMSHRDPPPRLYTCLVAACHYLFSCLSTLGLEHSLDHHPALNFCLTLARSFVAISLKHQELTWLLLPALVVYRWNWPWALWATATVAQIFAERQSI